MCFAKTSRVSLLLDHELDYISQRAITIILTRDSTAPAFCLNASRHYFSYCNATRGHIAGRHGSWQRGYPPGQGAPQANAAAGSTSNLAVMGITGFVATQEIGQLAQLAQTVLDIPEAPEKGTMDRGMFKKVLEQPRQGSEGITGADTGEDLH